MESCSRFDWAKVGSQGGLGIIYAITQGLLTICSLSFSVHTWSIRKGHASLVLAALSDIDTASTVSFTCVGIVWTKLLHGVRESEDLIQFPSRVSTR